MRLLAGMLLLAVVPRTAIAEDEDPDVEPVKTVTGGLYFSGHAGTLDGVAAGGLGPTAELALGSGRTQYVLEGGVAWVTLGASDVTDDGVMVRGALGARWIARSFDFDREGALEMTLAGLAGVRKSWWDARGEVVRPELGFGAGLQMRKYRRPHLGIRFEIRVVFTPGHDGAMTAARCTGDCEDAAPASSAGMMFSIGGAL